MTEEKIDDILVRVDEIEKLQTELRHLVPRVTSNSSRQARRQDLSRDSSTSIRFPSLFTFPVISNFTSSPPKNERVQKSAAQLNLSSKLSSGNRSLTVNLKNAKRPLTNATFTKERNIFKDLIKTTNNNAKLHEKYSLASTSGINPKTSVTPTKSANASCTASRKIMKKELKSETLKTMPKNKMQHVIGEKSNMRLAKNERTNSIRSSVQTSDIQIHAQKTARSGNIWSSLIRRNRRPDRISTGTLVERIMEKLNYCFLDNKKVTVPCNHPGTRIPKRVQVSRSSAIEGSGILRLHVSVAKIDVN